MNRVTETAAKVNRKEIPSHVSCPESRTDTNAVLWNLIDEQCRKADITPPRRFFDTGLILLSDTERFFGYGKNSGRGIVAKLGTAVKMYHKEIMDVARRNGAVMCANKLCADGEAFGVSHNGTSALDAEGFIQFALASNHFSDGKAALTNKSFLNEFYRASNPEPEHEPKHTVTLSTDQRMTGAKLFATSIQMMMNEAAEIAVRKYIESQKGGG